MLRGYIDDTKCQFRERCVQKCDCGECLNDNLNTKWPPDPPFCERFLRKSIGFVSLQVYMLCVNFMSIERKLRPESCG